MSHHNSYMVYRLMMLSSYWLFQWSSYGCSLWTQRIFINLPFSSQCMWLFLAFILVFIVPMIHRVSWFLWHNCFYNLITMPMILYCCLAFWFCIQSIWVHMISVCSSELAKSSFLSCGISTRLILYTMTGCTVVLCIVFIQLLFIFSFNSFISLCNIFFIIFTDKPISVSLSATNHFFSKWYSCCLWWY